MKRAVPIATAIALVAACALGGCVDDQPSAVAPATPSLVLTAAPEASDNVVARVNGQPVLASCVAAQAWAASPRDALQACIDLELLAQQAAPLLGARNERAAGGDDAATELQLQRLRSDAVMANRLAMADELVRREFTAKVTSYRDLPPEMLSLRFERLARKYGQPTDTGLNRPEFRAYRYVRIKLGRAATDAVGNAKAKTAIDRVYAMLAPHRGVLGSSLLALGQAPPAELGVPKEQIEVRTGDLSSRESLDDTFANALFSLAEPGMVSPPIRTRWGWDIVYLEKVWPAEFIPRERIANEMFPTLRLEYFATWASGLATKAGTAITIHDDVLTRTSTIGG